MRTYDRPYNDRSVKTRSPTPEMLGWKIVIEILSPIVFNRHFLISIRFSRKTPGPVLYHPKFFVCLFLLVFTGNHGDSVDNE